VQSRPGLQDKEIRCSALGKLIPAIRPLPASLLLLATGVGSLVLITMATLALVPVLVSVGLVAALVLAALFCGWAGIEGLAALERWMESDPRFKR